MFMLILVAATIIVFSKDFFGKVLTKSTLEFQGSRHVGFLLLLEYARHVLPQGLSSFCSFLLNALLSDVCISCSLFSSRSLLTTHFPSEACPDHLIWISVTPHLAPKLYIPLDDSCLLLNCYYQHTVYFSYSFFIPFFHCMKPEFCLFCSLALIDFDFLTESTSYHKILNIMLCTP